MVSAMVTRSSSVSLPWRRKRLHPGQAEGIALFLSGELGELTAQRLDLLFVILLDRTDSPPG